MIHMERFQAVFEYYVSRIAGASVEELTVSEFQNDTSVVYVFENFADMANALLRCLENMTVSSR